VFAWVSAGCGRLDFTPIETIDAAQAPRALSCEGLAPTCGAALDANCCDSPLVPGGVFYRSHDVAADGLYAPTTYPATVSPFYLDRYEVTVARFRQFVDAGMGLAATAPAASEGGHPLLPGSGWDTSWNPNLVTDIAALNAGLASCVPSSWTPTPGANENLPLNCVTWYEAFAFCIWDGGYLPTEAEWNYAAAGGDEQRAYPWSFPPDDLTIDCSYANYSLSSGYCVNPPNGGFEPVGTHSPQSDGRWGHADLAGNVWEKTLDYYVGSSNGGYANATCDDCANLVPDSARSARGGGWNGDDSVARPAYRYYDPPYDRYVEMGMRCARPMH
jgi:formylglycine-generating enzyme required for sulfatase activity